jgi:NAD(P)-dependent dehydrogenase (short-subunit alcohol dehydrogenase family)
MASFSDASGSAYLQSMFGLEGKVAIVTGSTGGLGFSLAEALFRAGATVVVNGRGEERSLKARDEIYAKVDRWCNFCVVCNVLVPYAVPEPPTSYA